MLRRFRAMGVNDKISCDFLFFNDINVITGRNGSGKTTILKAIWYLMSANIERIPREMSFDLLALETDKFNISITRISDRNPRRPDAERYRIDYVSEENRDTFDISLTGLQEEEAQVRRANHIIGACTGSLFFPTFRRIEGGFSMGRTEFSRHPMYYPPQQGGYEAIEAGFRNLSERLSIFHHTFVASISTDDIVRLLTEKYAQISEATNRQHRELSNAIIDLTTRYTGYGQESDESALHHAQQILDEINAKVVEFNTRTDAELRPFTTLSELVSGIYENKGIRITENVVLGDVKNSISSGMLSSGEKQMLSFLCYNALSTGQAMFIDEPEISLHVDWQRILFPTLLKQDTGNQFVIATHSPFIYTKYADKELTLNIDRGESSEPTTLE